MKTTTAFAFLSLAFCVVTATHADTFGSGANQFTIDFVPISGSTNPTSAQTTAGDLDGFGIVDYNYRMGVHEITNGQWDKFESSLGVPVTGDPSHAYDEGPYYHGADVPTNEVSWYEAAQFVNWLNTYTNHQAAYKFTGTQGTGDYALATWSPVEAAGGTNLYRHKDAFYFLPTEHEWFKAAYWNGTMLQDYATKAGESLFQGNGSNGGWNYQVDSDNGPDGPGSWPWNVGSGSEELNGTYDMMGNVWEWVESPYNDPNYGTGSGRNVRSSGWFRSSYYFHAFYRVEGSHPPWVQSESLGFRVASIPEPSTLLLSLIGLTAIGTRRRRFGK